jgi:uncharacterized membrane protein YebE (DUF533 family)
MNNKTIMMGLGVIGIGAIAYYLYKKNKDNELAKAKKGEMTPTSKPTTITKNFANLVVDMSEVADEDGDNAIEIID